MLVTHTALSVKKYTLRGQQQRMRLSIFC